MNVIDTIGFDDPDNDTDVKIIAELVSQLKNNCDFVNLFGIAVNGQSPRLDGSLVAMIAIFEEMFGEQFWNQCVLLFTRITMNGADKKRRAKVTKKSDNDRAKEYAREVEKRFPNSAGGLKYLFLDACYDEETQEEADHFHESMGELYAMLSSAPKLATSSVNKNVQTENARLQNAMRKYEEEQEDARKEIEGLKENLNKVQDELSRKLEKQLEETKERELEVKKQLEEQREERERPGDIFNIDNSTFQHFHPLAGNKNIWEFTGMPFIFRQASISSTYPSTFVSLFVHFLLQIDTSQSSSSSMELFALYS